MPRFNSTIISLLMALFSVIASTGFSYAYEPPRSALQINVETGQTMFDDASSEIRHPASLTKMMTLYMLFEALHDKKISLETPVVGSRHSADRPPSRLGLQKDEVIPVDLAIDALVVRSANDVAAAVGELLGGTEEAFAELMTNKARQLGMKDTVYRNASGLPNSEQVTTARDQAILGLALKKDFPEYYRRFSAREVSYKDRTWSTHNNLLEKYDVVTGIKTGFINASGFNIVTYAELPEGDRIIVVMGGRSAKERDQVAIDLLEGRTPFHLLNDDQKIVRTAEVAAKKDADKKALTELKDEERRLAALEKEKESAIAAANTPAENAIVAVVEPTTTASTLEVASLEVASIEPELAAEGEEIAVQPIQPYAIQVGALPSQERANERLSLARPALREQNLRQYMLPLETSRGTVYRARFIGFASMQAAFDACDVMKSEKIECMALIQK